MYFKTIAYETNLTELSRLTTNSWAPVIPMLQPPKWLGLFTMPSSGCNFKVMYQMCVFFSYWVKIYLLFFSQVESIWEKCMVYGVTDKQEDGIMKIHIHQNHLGSEAFCCWPLPWSAISDLPHPQAYNAALCWVLFGSPEVCLHTVGKVYLWHI